MKNKIIAMGFRENVQIICFCSVKRRQTRFRDKNHELYNITLRYEIMRTVFVAYNIT